MSHAPSRTALLLILCAAPAWAGTAPERTRPHERITVQAQRGGLLAPATSAATKTRTALVLVPQNVSVITADRMALLNERSLSEVVRYSAGVSDYGGKDDPRGYFGTIRGFTPDIYLDGTRLPDAATSLSWAIEPFGLEQFDILRGASSGLYGAGQLGGILNAVSKRPRFSATDSADIQLGSFKRVQGDADLGGSLNASRTLLWRLVGLARHSSTYADNILDNEIYVAPSLRWIAGPRTDLTLLSSYTQRDNGSTAQFLPALGTITPSRYGRIPRDALSSDRDFDVYSKRQVSVGYALTHRLAEGWTVNQTVRFAHLDTLYRFVTTQSLAADQKTLARQALLQSGNDNTVTVDTNTELRAVTGPVAHDLLAGIDFRDDFVGIRRGARAAPSIDIYAPKPVRVAYPRPASTISTNETEHQTGLYLQDQAQWRRFTLTLTGREDLTGSTTVDNLTRRRTPQTNNATTGRVGLVYAAPFDLFPYVSYATSFQPQVGTTRLGASFVPTTGKQVEAGIKYRAPNGRFLATADAFDLVEHNVLTTDPADSTYSIQTGAQRTRGVELEATGRLPGRIDVIAAATYQEPRITRSSVAAQIGQRPVTVPSHMASAFVEKGVRLSPTVDGGLGAGMRYTGNTAGALPNSVLVPSQLVWDAQAHMDYRKLHLQLNGTNLADRHYVAICTRSVACAWAPGRAVFFTAGYSL